MRSLLLIAAVLVAGALALEPDQKCKPGSTFKMECNTCRCSADGKVVSCTRKFCVPEEQGDDPKVQPAAAAATEEVSNGQQDLTADKEEEHVHTNGQVCTPNEVKMEDCNRCKCAANGIGWFCTRKTCPPRERRAVDAVQPAPQCTPGTSFKSSDGCNDCVCGPTGLAACTMKFCFFEPVPAKPKSKRQVTVPKCVPLTLLKHADGCNDCTCKTDGEIWCSDYHLCFSPYNKKPDSCVPGTSFKHNDGCNDCYCSKKGVAACTTRSCASNSRTKRQVTKSANQCEPGTSFKHSDGCNDCFCTETGVAACTARYCLSNPRTKRQITKSAKQCEPGTSFKSADGCNDCFCTETGLAACTMKFCFFNTKTKRDVAQPQPPKQECVPGTSFKSADGCNDCFCSDNGQAACTLKFCFFEPVPVAKPKRQAALPEKECEPGTQFMDAEGCNQCFCTATGHAACTEKLCLPETPAKPYKRSTNEELPVSEFAPNTPGFTCNPGKSFKYQCNTCRCDTSGNSAACTFKFCLPGEY